MPVWVSGRVCLSGSLYDIIRIQALSPLLTPRGSTHVSGVAPARTVSVRDRSTVDGRDCPSTYAVARGRGRLTPAGCRPGSGAQRAAAQRAGPPRGQGRALVQLNGDNFLFYNKSLG